MTRHRPDRHAAVVVGVCAQRTTPLVGGARAAELARHGCSLDLHPHSPGSGSRRWYAPRSPGQPRRLGFDRATIKITDGRFGDALNASMPPSPPTPARDTR
ncbi:hypothetical protein [Streptomyces sp. NBC_01006]|uniref:hypothetical protein n=1 Tax=Streptomyces sp. NBC_01006 TaxID=2903716 RepID=UPI00386D2E61